MNKINEQNIALAIVISVFFTIACAVGVVVGLTLFLTSYSQPISTQTELWTSQQAGYWGMVFGRMGGFFGSSIGGLSSFYKYKWAFKAQIFSLFIMAIFGAITTLAGGIFFMINQPKHIWYPFILPGLLFLFLGIIMIPVIHKRRIAIEQQKIKALDTNN